MNNFAQLQEKTVFISEFKNTYKYPTKNYFVDGINEIGSRNEVVPMDVNGLKTMQEKKEITQDFPSTRAQFIEKLIGTPFLDLDEPDHQSGPDYIIPCNRLFTSSIKEPVITADISEATYPKISMVTLLENTVKALPNKLALAVKRDGQWIYWTYLEYWNEVRTVAKAFIKLGLERFHGVGVLGFNSPEWIIATFATIFAGGVSTGIYTTNSPDACEFVLQDSSAQICVVENDFQLKKILNIRDNLPHLKTIVQFLGEPTAIDVLSWNDLKEIGASIPDDILDKRIKGLALNQCCSLIYTSGTTENPRGVMLSHDNLAYEARYSVKVVGLKYDHHKVLSYLPLSHIAAQIGDLYAVIAVGGTTYFATPDALKGKLVDCMKEVKPTYIVGVPRVWEKIADKIKEFEKAMSPVKRNIFKWARKQALNFHATRGHSDSSPTLSFKLAQKLVLKKVRKALGLHRCEMILTGGAPLNVDTLKYLASLDVWIAESYGTSETTGPNSENYNYPVSIGSIGKFFPEISCKLLNPAGNEYGEICLRGRVVGMGYLNAEDKTREIFLEDGYCRTGDIGYMTDEGHIFISGRIKEIIVTAGGENVAPLPIEDRVKATLPVVSNCILIGDRRRFLTMIITLKVEVDLETFIPKDELAPAAVDWCTSIGSQAKTVSSILQEPDKKVMDAVQKGFAQVNEKAISNAQRIQKWVILPKDFSLPGGEFGPSMKLKKNYILEKYADLIDSMYRC